jgi:hypothetical protein
VITSGFYILSGIDQSKPNAADGDQIQSFYASLATDTQSELDNGDAARNLSAYLAGGNSITARRVTPRGCHFNVRCIHSICRITCIVKG